MNQSLFLFVRFLFRTSPFDFKHRKNLAGLTKVIHVGDVHHNTILHPQHTFAPVIFI